MTRPTRVVHSHQHDADLYAFGHVSALRKGDKIRLTVNATPTQAFTTPALSPQGALHAADCLRAASANTDGGACAGKSIVELIMDELLSVIDRLMSEGEAEDGRDPGRAEGLAYALAVFQNPYMPNVEAIKEQAMDLWYEENGDE